MDIKDDEILGKSREARTFYRLGISPNKPIQGKFYSLHHMIDQSGIN